MLDNLLKISPYNHVLRIHCMNEIIGSLPVRANNELTRDCIFCKLY